MPDTPEDAALIETALDIVTPFWRHQTEWGEQVRSRVEMGKVIALVRAHDAKSELDALDAMSEHVEELASANEALTASLAEAEARAGRAEAAVERMREALTWYAEQAEGCRKLGSIGDPARHALDRDGGKRARAALQEPTDGC